MDQSIIIPATYGARDGCQKSTSMRMWSTELRPSLGPTTIWCSILDVNKKQSKVSLQSRGWSAWTICPFWSRWQGNSIRFMLAIHPEHTISKSITITPCSVLWFSCWVGLNYDACRLIVKFVLLFYSTDVSGAAALTSVVTMIWQNLHAQLILRIWAFFAWKLKAEEPKSISISIFQLSAFMDFWLLTD